MFFISLFDNSNLESLYGSAITNIALYIMIATVMVFLLAVIGAVFEEFSELTADVFYAIAAVIGIFAIIAFIFIFCACIAFPIFYIGGIIKSWFVAKFSLMSISFFKDLFISIICGLIVAIPYCLLISKGIKNVSK